MRNTHLYSTRKLLAAIAMAATAGGQAVAQVAPNAAEVAAYTGLHAAAQKGDIAKIDRLAAAKADLNARDSNGRTPLHVAAFAGQREAIKALVKRGADINLMDKDRYDGVTIAAVANDEETLSVLLAQGASAKLVTSRYDGTALIAAAHLEHAGVLKQLIAAGAPLDLVNNLHWTAAIEAVVLGDGGVRHQETLRALINAGANLQLTDRHGNTPLQLAQSRSYQEMVGMLERAGTAR